MPVVLISSSPHGLCPELAESLVEKTGWPVYSRNLLVERAHESGIKLSRLATSIVKSPVINEKLARERDLYLALVTKTMCEEAVDGNLIYFGRAGHLLLPGICGVLRVGIGNSLELRIERAKKQLNLSEEKAKEYIEKLDEDITKWIHYVHRETSENMTAYDLFINLEHMSIENASSILYETALTHDFRCTEESRNEMYNRCLAANAKIHLAQNPGTSGMDLGVRAINGVVTVTYMPRQEVSPDDISHVLEELEECRESICTMAETNILWIQESFEPDGKNFDEVTQLAKRWGAAVELLQLNPGDEETTGQLAKAVNKSGNQASQVDTGGVEDDDIEGLHDDKGLSRTVEKLIAIGRSAGGFSISGANREVIDAVKDNDNYSLIILGDLFLSKGHETSTRLTREMGLDLKEKLKAHVIMSGDLHSRFLFGKNEAFKLFGFATATVLIYLLVFTFQEPILDVLGGDLHTRYKWLASVGIALFVPLVAYVYSTVTGLVLKIIGID